MKAMPIKSKSEIAIVFLAAIVCMRIMQHGCANFLFDATPYRLAPVDVSSAESQSTMNRAFFGTENCLARFESVVVGKGLDHMVHARARITEEDYIRLQDALATFAYLRNSTDSARMISRFAPIYNIQKERVDAVWESSNNTYFIMIVVKSSADSFDLYLSDDTGDFPSDVGERFWKMLQHRPRRGITKSTFKK
jgi:hypothetical protein